MNIFPKIDFSENILLLFANRCLFSSFMIRFLKVFNTSQKKYCILLETSHRVIYFVVDYKTIYIYIYISATILCVQTKNLLKMYIHKYFTWPFLYKYWVIYVLFVPVVNFGLCDLYYFGGRCLQFHSNII